MTKKLFFYILFLSLLLNANHVFANFFAVAEVSGSGMAAQRTKMDTIAENIANVDTVHTEEGTPYVRKYVILSQGSGIKSDSNIKGVKVAKIAKDRTPFKKVYEPANPYADENGLVDIPNINTIKEMINMMSASRAFEANIQVFNASKDMAKKALNIGR